MNVPREQICVIKPVLTSLDHTTAPVSVATEGTTVLNVKVRFSILHFINDNCNFDCARLKAQSYYIHSKN